MKRAPLRIAVAALMLATPTVVAASPAAAVIKVAEFPAECPFTHRLPDDPIVFPNLPGASHSHDFMGSRATNASTTLASLQSSTSTCNPAIDVSAYWVPTVFNNNVAVPPSSATFYYLGEGVSSTITARIQPFPLGLRIIAGSSTATGPTGSRSRWSCLNAGQVPPSGDFVTCPAGTKLETYLDFPQCWNGRDLDSADHKAHMAYPVANACPSTHPVPVPKLRMVIRWPLNGSPAGFRLASGNGYSMHGDFFNAWPVAAQAQRVRDCINAIVKCDANGRPIP